MAGIFQGIKDTLTGKGGAPGSQVNDIAVQEWINRSLNDQQQARLMAGMSNARFEDQYRSQQNLLPLIYEQLGYGMDRTGGQWGNEVGNFRYQGTDAQRGLDSMARLGDSSLEALYANAGYSFTRNPDGSYSTPEASNSQRYQFLNAQGRQIAEAQQLRDQAYDDLRRQGSQVEGLYSEAAGNLRGAQGGQQEALDATRRQLQTAEGSQFGALQQLGFRRDPSGAIVKDDGSPLSSYERMLMQQATTAQGTQRAGLSNLGYITDANGNVSFDPNSSVGQMFAQYDRLRRDAAGQTGTARNLQGASLQRMGLMQDAQGNWVNDPNANEAAMRSLQGDYLKRASAAMQGNAPVDPGMERSLAEEKRTLYETMGRQLGPGWMSSSIGQEAIRSFEQRANESRYKVQQDALGLGTTQALGLQGMNLQTLASLYASGDPVLRAMAAESGISEAALNARNQNAATAQGLSAQGAGTVSQMAGTQSNINAQTLAGLYGLTAPALAAAGQLGNQTNANIATNQNAYANLNNMSNANLNALMQAYGMVGQLGGQTQNAINNRAAGALNFQNANNNVLQGIPQAQQQLYGNANQGRMASLSALYPALQSAGDQSQVNSLMQLYGSLGGQGGQLGLGSAGAVDEGNYRNYQTNINNVFWQNFMKSFGQSAGSSVGSGGMGAGSGSSIFT